MEEAEGVYTLHSTLGQHLLKPLCVVGEHVLKNLGVQLWLAQDISVSVLKRTSNERYSKQLLTPVL